MCRQLDRYRLLESGAVAVSVKRQEQIFTSVLFPI